MFTSPSIVTRIAVGKLAGLAVGLLGFLVFPFVFPDAGPLFRWGVMLWYLTFGAFIGLMGVLDHHPVLKIRMPWWFRGALVGGWLNFVLTFFAHDQFAAYMAQIVTPGTLWASPWWFVLEGVLVGMLIAWIATRLGGEGKHTLDELPG